MKILVTGATGFIGSYVVEHLISQGYHVIASGTSSSGKLENKNWFDKVQYIPWRIGDPMPDDLFTYFNQPDYVIHLAWSNLSDYRSLLHFEKNLPDHYLFLKNLVRNGLTNITVCGTCFEYGMQEGCLSEEMNVQPGNAYALAKYALYKFLQELQHQYPFNLKWLRLFYVYGEGQAVNSLIPQLRRAVENDEKIFNMSKGEQVRDFLPVEEMAERICELASQNQVAGIINCCSGKPVKVLDFVRNYIKTHNFKIELNTGHYPYSPLEPFSFWGDTKKADMAIQGLNYNENRSN